MSEAPVPLLIPPELPPLPRGGRLPAAPLALPAQAQSSDTESGPIFVGVAAIDGSGRVRERAVLAALAWGPGEALDIRIIRDVAILRAAQEGCVRVDGRDQIALPAGCRVVLGIKPGDRVVFAAHPARGVGLIYPMSVASGWIRAHIASLPEVLDA